MTKPQEILFVTRSLSSARGGMQLFASVLLSELSARADVRVTVVSHTGSTLGLPFFFLYAAYRAILFRGRTVHFTDAALSPAAFLVRVFRPGQRMTLTVHGLDVTYPSLPYQLLLRVTLPRFSMIAAVSTATKWALEARDIDSSRIVVVRNGIRMPTHPHSARRSDTPTLLLLGRQIERKGTIWFLRNVFPDVLRAHPSAVCIIAGDGPELPRIRKVIADLFLKNSVRVLGEVDEETKDRLFRESTLFVMPNVFIPGDMEGFGLVCIEAAARGLPVVAARLEGIQDAVIEGVTGEFFFSEDPADACKVIDAALSKTWESSTIAAACAERYSAADMASHYISSAF